MAVVRVMVLFFCSFRPIDFPFNEAKILGFYLVYYYSSFFSLFAMKFWVFCFLLKCLI